MVAALRLVHAPISNQLADTLLNGSPNVRAVMSGANLYMIAARKQAKFADFQYDPDTGILKCQIKFESLLLGVELDTAAIVDEYSDNKQTHFKLCANENAIDFVEEYDEERVKVFMWLTPDKLLYLHSRGSGTISVTGSYADLLKYDLLYIGMSDDNAFKRLVEKPHHARLNILTNELGRDVSGRLSEEIMFFFFSVEPLYVSKYRESEDIDDVAVDMMLDHESVIPPTQVVRDAEKAFIKVLDTKYNKRKYMSYPSVKGGLHESILDNYAYYIDETVQFDVGSISFRGVRDPLTGMSNDADCISVCGDMVTVFDAARKLEIVIS